MKPINKVLLIRPRFLGDLILVTGLAEVFHQDSPKAEVWVLTEKLMLMFFKTTLA